jgi:ABC-2 type transport system ATP-binding protein
MIQVDRLTKVYANGKGVFDVDLSVLEGEVFGFMGPNGAGKTTAIRVLLGFTSPTAGSCRINGHDARTGAAEIQRQLGYVPGEAAFLEHMTGLGFMRFVAEMRGLQDTSRRDRLIERFELEPDRKIRKMSKGMKQKVGLVTAFMHDPAVFILDEPTAGLDPLMQRRFIELIQEEKGRGKTVLMSSHQFDEVERTCDRAAIIREGKIVATEDIASLRTSLRRGYLVTVAGSGDMETIRQSGLAHRVAGERSVEIFVSDDYSKMLSTLAACTVTGLEHSAQSLEQTFIRFYGEEVK